MQDDPSLLPIALHGALGHVAYWNLPRASALWSCMPSTVIKSFEYDAPSRELLVVFRSGRRYVYLDVSEERFLGMRSAFSKGDYFNTHIRESYKFIRLPEDA
jgi:KTSC domain